MSHPFLPKPGFFVPGAWYARRFRHDVRAAARDAARVLHFTHGPCLDGAACDVLVRLKHGEDGVRTRFLNPHETLPALEVVADVPANGRELVVSDLSFQKGEGDRVRRVLERVTAAGWTVTWRDHHHKQWEGAPMDAFREIGTFRLDATGSECGATLVAKDLLPGDAFAREFARVVRDHDLWLRKDPRSIRIQQASAHAGMPRFVERVLETRRLDDPLLEAWSDQEEARREDLVARALKRAWMTVGRHGVVGVAYGNVPANEVLHTLMERGAHLAILLKPAGTFSLRSVKGVPVCHLVAQSFNGGGHPNASGGKLTLPAPAWPAYWATLGRVGGRGLVTEAVARVDEHLA